MTSIPPGWYPDPNGGPGQRYFDGNQWTQNANSPTAVSGFAGGSQPAVRGGLPGWAWAAIAAGLTLFVVCVVAGVVVFVNGPAMPDSSTNPSTAQSASPQRSGLMPELQLPAGATKRNYSSSELWDVPLPYADTVEALRPQLRIGRVYDGLAWCSEFTRGEHTAWSWGAESDYLTVMVDPASQGDGSEVSVAREPNPSGCQR